MRITFLLSSLWLSGGVLLVVDYANRLVQRGHHVTLVLPGGAIDATVQQKLAAEVKIVEGNWRLIRPVPPWRLALHVLDLVRSAPCSDVAIATHTPTTIPILLLRLRQKTCRQAWLYMDYDEMFRKRPLERLLLHWMPRFFDLLMPISQPLAEQVRNKTKGVVVMTGAGLARQEHFSAATTPNANDNQWRVLYVGDTRPRKGLREFLAAMALVYQQAPNLELVIVSKEPAEITTPVPYQLHIYPADEALVALYRHCDLFVSCSWGEGLGYPPLEAMACGTPVVLTDSIGVRDYARDEVNCLVVPPRDPAAIAAATLRLAQDPALAQRLVEQGKATVRHYQWDRVIDRVETALTSLIKE
jgi:glycosyltransferase involved in cell wall biosynthesis